MARHNTIYEIVHPELFQTFALKFPYGHTLEVTKPQCGQSTDRLNSTKTVLKAKQRGLWVAKVKMPVSVMVKSSAKCNHLAKIEFLHP